MRLKKNDVLTVEVEDITNLGFGVAKSGGEVIFISDTVPGDTAEIKIIKCASSYSVARLMRLVTPSPERTLGRCTLSCRACAYRALSYEAELSLKGELVKSAFKKAGLTGVKIMPPTASPHLLAYRNKAEYPISRDAYGEYIIGFYAPKSHRVTEAADCPLAPEIFARILRALREFFKEYSLSTYDEATGEGLLRHVYLRRGETTGEVLLTLVINGKTLPHSDELVRRIPESFPEVVGILLNVNTEKTNVVLGGEYVTLFGRDYIYDVLAGVKLKITAPSFYQVNRAAAELIYYKARELAGLTGDELLLDLYCGAGSIGLSMAEDARELIGIEIVESAVECARENALENGVTNASFYSADAAHTESLLSSAERTRGEKIRPDVIILDPPRKGCEEGLLRYIASLAPSRVVYVSCNPATLARDVRVLTELGYSAGEVWPYDLFPMTGHVESVVCLKRQIQQ